MPSTIFDVARAAGVSTGTVSRALNQHPEVSAATRARVLKVAGSIGYTPDPLARGMVTRATTTVGLIVPDVASPFFHELARGVEDVASANGQLVVLCNSDRQIERERQYLAALRAHRAGGLILAGAPHQPPSPECPTEKGPPTVLVIRREPAGCPALLLDYRAAVREVVAYLVSLGHRRTGYVNGPLAHGNAEDRLAGYREALEHAGQAFDPRLTTAAEFSIEGGYDAAVRLLDLSEPPTAIALANDYMALGAIQAIRARGLSVPEDVSVVGFDDFVVASLVEPRLTTVRVAMREMGARAMHLLIEQIEHRQRPGRAETHRGTGAQSKGSRPCGAGEGGSKLVNASDEDQHVYYVPTSLVIRESTARCRAGSR